MMKIPRHISRLFCLMTLLISGSMSLTAQTSDTKQTATHTSSLFLSVGSANVMDTYLSPYSYKGTRLDLTTEKQYTHTMHRFTAHVGMTESMAKNVDEYDFGLAFATAHHFGLYQDEHFCIKAGPMGYLNIGGIYNERNGNNPAQAKVSLMADLSAQAVYGFNCKGRRIKIEYSFDLPVLGIAYSPQFGQSYYEQFVLNDYDHNVVFAHPCNTPSLRHRLLINFPLGGKRCYTGYNSVIEQSTYNKLRYHSYSHAFIIGIQL